MCQELSLGNSNSRHPHILSPCCVPDTMLRALYKNSISSYWAPTICTHGAKGFEDNDSYVVSRTSVPAPHYALLHWQWLPSEHLLSAWHQAHLFKESTTYWAFTVCQVLCQGLCRTIIAPYCASDTRLTLWQTANSSHSLSANYMSSTVPIHV